MPALHAQQLAELTAELPTDPQTVLAWAADRFPGQIAIATALGPQSLAIIHMLHALGRSVPVLFLDTGLHFEQTYTLRAQIEARFGFEIRAVRPQQTVAEQDAAHGAALWARDPNACCQLRKVFPLSEALAPYDAWITGLRRASGGRSHVRPIEYDHSRGMIKVNPLATWTRAEVFAYLQANDVPFNPLLGQGYRSIGCWPCTHLPNPDAAPDDERAGRWSGHQKTECGLHGST